MSENSILMNSQSHQINLMDLLSSASEKDDGWKYRQIPVSADSGFTSNTFDRFNQNGPATWDQSNSKENFRPFINANKSLLPSPFNFNILPAPDFKCPPKENGAHAVSNSFNHFNNLPSNSEYQVTFIKNPFTDTSSQQTTQNRLDTFLNLSSKKSIVARQPVPPAIQQIFQNYQYNPQSTINRIKGCITWDGYLPPRMGKVSGEFSKKVFFGGVPWDVSEQQIIQTFNKYGEFKIEWPNNFNSRRNTTKSFLYLIFENLESINSLLLDCSKEKHGGSATYNYSMKLDSSKVIPIQVIPWISCDNIAMYTQDARLNNKLTVFVGALHGRIYAQALGLIFEELFQNVAFVQIDTDRYKYPIGSGRVTFSTTESYRKAIEENFITIIAPKFSKRVQIEPYIEDEPCGKCHVISAPNFCKSRLCFEYFCDNCWAWQHSLEGLRNHAPVKRNRKIERY